MEVEFMVCYKTSLKRETVKKVKIVTAGTHTGLLQNSSCILDTLF
jgi:hypothetical protein